MSDQPSTTYFDRERSTAYDGRAARLLRGLCRRVAADVTALAGPARSCSTSAPVPGGCCTSRRPAVRTWCWPVALFAGVTAVKR